MALKTGVPVAFGVITADTLEQVVEREEPKWATKSNSNSRGLAYLLPLCSADGAGRTGSRKIFISAALPIWGQTLPYRQTRLGRVLAAVMRGA